MWLTPCESAYCVSFTASSNATGEPNVIVPSVTGDTRITSYNVCYTKLLRFIGRFLNPLKLYDQEHGSSLLRTLEAYLDSNCSTKLTAQILFTHYNTVTYRVEKIV